MPLGWLLPPGGFFVAPISSNVDRALEPAAGRGNGLVGPPISRMHERPPNEAAAFVLVDRAVRRYAALRRVRHRRAPTPAKPLPSRTIEAGSGMADGTASTVYLSVYDMPPERCSIWGTQA